MPVTEIAADCYRISTYIPEIDLQFNQFLFHQNGNVEPLTESDVVDRARKTLIDYQAGPFANYMPYTKHTDGIMQGLAALSPRTIAPMHGSAYSGDGAQAIRDLAVVMREVLG